MTTNLKGLAAVLKKAKSDSSVINCVNSQKSRILHDLQANKTTVITDERGRKFKVTVVEEKPAG